MSTFNFQIRYTARYSDGTLSRGVKKYSIRRLDGQEAERAAIDALYRDIHVDGAYEITSVAITLI